jgi:hypothetical protein
MRTSSRKLVAAIVFPALAYACGGNDQTSNAQHGATGGPRMGGAGKAEEVLSKVSVDSAYTLLMADIALDPPANNAVKAAIAIWQKEFFEIPVPAKQKTATAQGDAQQRRVASIAKRDTAVVRNLNAEQTALYDRNKRRAGDG